MTLNKNGNKIILYYEELINQLNNIINDTTYNLYSGNLDFSIKDSLKTLYDFYNSLTYLKLWVIEIIIYDIHIKTKMSKINDKLDKLLLLIDI